MTTQQATPDRVSQFDSLPDSALFRLPEVTQLLGVSEATIWRMDKRGTLKSVKLSERLRGWRVGDIRAHLAA